MFVFDNMLVAGTILVRDQIESQNWESSGHTAGWAVKANGDAFFFNITAAGNIRADRVTTGSAPDPFIDIYNDSVAHIEMHSGDPSAVAPFQYVLNPGELTLMTEDLNAGQVPTFTLSSVDSVTQPDGGFTFVGSPDAPSGRSQMSIEWCDINISEGSVNIFPMRAQTAIDAGPLATTSVPFVSLASAANVTVPAVLSGTVYVGICGDVANSLAANAGNLGFEVRANTAGGAVLQAATLGNSAIQQGTNRSTLSTGMVVTGLPTTGDIFVRAMFASDNAANTATFRRIHLTVIPLL